MGPKWSIYPKQFFLVQTIVITFIYLLAVFIVQNSRKFLTADPELWGCAILGPKMVHLPQTKFFLEKKLNIIFIYLLTPSKCTKFLKNSYSGSRVMRMCHFGGQNGPIAQMRIFFRKSVYEPCSFHSCLSTYQKSKSDINL